MLDRRFLIGNASLFEKLDAKVMSGPEKQARAVSADRIAAADARPAEPLRNTIFHLEPNVKEAPGGLRDYHATLWMRQLAGDRRDPRISPVNEDELTRQCGGVSERHPLLSALQQRAKRQHTDVRIAGGGGGALAGHDDNLRRNAAEWMRLISGTRAR